LFIDDLNSTLSALRTARWRSDPATDPQKKIITSRWQKSKLQNMNQEDIENKIKSLTKGEAADIITRWKHGTQVSDL